MSFTYYINEIFKRHAYETGCGDCFDYSNSVGYALPYLQAAGLDTCKVHKVVQQSSSASNMAYMSASACQYWHPYFPPQGAFQLPHLDPERGFLVARPVKQPASRGKHAR